MIFTSCVSGVGDVWGVTLRPGDILVADPDFVHVGWKNDNPDFEPMQPTVWKVDPVSGVREVITSEIVGGGVPLRSSTAVVVDRQGRLTVADPYSAALLRVDPATGDRSYLTRASDVGAGPFIQTVSALAVDDDDSLVVIDHLAKNIVRVDPVSGDRSIISGPTRGAGPLWSFESTVAIERCGDILAPVYDDNLRYGLLRVDAMTGDRTIVSGLGVGAGPELRSADDLVLVDRQRALVTSLGSLVELDLTTGNRTVVDVDGPRIERLYAVARGLDGSYLLGDEHAGSVFRLDLASRSYGLLSGNTPEWGPRMWMPQDMFVVVAEPSGGALAVVGFFAPGALRRRGPRG